MKLISTTALAKQFQRTTKEMFAELLNKGLITKNGGVWELTAEGQKRGGKYKESKQYGKYIVWPENFVAGGTPLSEKTKLITATAISKEFGLSPIKINYILSELGWISKGIKGWVLSEQGKKHGGGAG